VCVCVCVSLYLFYYKCTLLCVWFAMCNHFDAFFFSSVKNCSLYWIILFLVCGRIRLLYMRLFSVGFTARLKRMLMNIELISGWLTSEKIILKRSYHTCEAYFAVVDD
jgi:hypothetical protein